MGKILKEADAEMERSVSLIQTRGPKAVKDLKLRMAAEKARLKKEKATDMSPVTALTSQLSEVESGLKVLAKSKDDKTNKTSDLEAARKRVEELITGSTPTGLPIARPATAEEIAAAPASLPIALPATVTESVPSICKDYKGNPVQIGARVSLGDLKGTVTAYVPLYTETESPIPRRPYKYGKCHVRVKWDNGTEQVLDSSNVQVILDGEEAPAPEVPETPAPEPESFEMINPMYRGPKPTDMYTKVGKTPVTLPSPGQAKEAPVETLKQYFTKKNRLGSRTGKKPGIGSSRKKTLRGRRGGKQNGRGSRRR